MKLITFGASMSKKEFVSKVTGEIWRKEFHGRWDKVIHHIAVLLEDYSSVGKNGEITTLLEGSEVFIDDIRGRIHPQFRVKDESGRIWFIPVTKLKVLDTDTKTTSVETDTHEYRGGVRTDHTR